MRSESASQHALEGVTAGDLMSGDCPSLDGNLDVQHFVDEELLRTGKRCFLVLQKGEVAGLVTPHEVKAIERARWPFTTLSDVMRPLEDLHTVPPETPLKDVLEIMGREDLNQVPVMANGTWRAFFRARMCWSICARGRKSRRKSEASRTANCSSRGSSALEITPKFEAPKIRPGQIEIRMVQRVVHIEAELRANTIGNRKLLPDGEIEAGQSGTQNVVTSRCPERIQSRECKSGRIEPGAGSLRTGVGIAHDIRTLDVVAVDEPDTGNILAGSGRKIDCERSAALHDENATGLPSAEDSMHPVPAPAKKRQIVNRVGGESEPVIETRGSFLRREVVRICRVLRQIVFGIGRPGVRSIIDGVGPGPAGGERKTAREPARHFQCQCVERRPAVPADRGEGIQRRYGAGAAGRSREH